LALPLRLQAQQVTPAAQIREGVALNQIVALLIYQRFEGNQVQSPIRRDEHLGRLSGQGADRLHDLLIYPTRQPLQISPLRIRQRLAKLHNRILYRFRISHLLPLKLSFPAQDVNHIMRFLIRLVVADSLNVERLVGCELNQHSMGRQRCLNGCEGDGLRLGAKLGAVPADLGFQLFLLLFQSFDLFLVLVGSDSFGPSQDESGQLCSDLIQLVQQSLIL
jgi:hypothetical protein